MKDESPQNDRTGFVAFIRRHPWLTTASSLVLLVGVLFLSVEWHAERRWQRYAAEARARGAKLYYTDLVRPEIRPEQNFAELPMLKKALTGGENEPPFKLPKWPRTKPAIAGRKSSSYDDIPPTLGNASKGEKTNWKDWQDYFQAVGFLTETTNDPARDVLRALEHYAPQFQEWSEWRTTRMQCQLPLKTANGKPVLSSTFIPAAMMFNLRLSAYLAEGHSAAAYADFQDGLEVARVLQSAPSMVNAMLRRGTLYFLLETMAVGLRDHTWADAELKKIKADLDALRMWEDFRAEMEAARCELNAATEKLMNTSFRERALMEDSFGLLGSRPAIAYQLTPRSVFRDNELRLNQYIDELTARGSTPEATFNLDREIPSSPVNLATSYDKEYYFIADLQGDTYEIVERQYIRLHILLDEARLASALERFRLAHGVYPATLAELVPEFIEALPVDIYGRGPYRYQRVAAASFQLYSVGENRRDDGGDAARQPAGQPPKDIVWQFAPAAGQ
ncbi:MAG TPA: hypothetical protein VK961_12320 [Chthoniobacter sp.]|nr:hypothetical protein [Chthoniobacter sp.]